MHIFRAEVATEAVAQSITAEPPGSNCGVSELKICNALTELTGATESASSRCLKRCIKRHVAY